MPTASALAHKTQLDTLRFLAVLAVFFYHSGLKPGHMPFADGYLGVDIFFALSGFLITRLILLAEQGQALRDLGVFYARRFLRIFPLYYSVLFVLLYLHKLPFPLWNFLYCFNIKQYLDHNWYGDLSHFWSLCVEEQFYLSFPPILLFCPAKYRLRVIATLLALSFVAGCIWSSVQPNSFWYILLPVRAQVLLMGCLFGYLEVKSFTGKWNGTAVFFIGLLVFSYFMQPGYGHVHYVGTIIKDLGLALIVLGLWKTENRRLLSVFCFPVLVYLGRISYGLYVFHLFSFPIREWLSTFYPWLKSVDETLAAGLITILLAVLSWHILEYPFNSLKKFFPYIKTPKPDAEQLAA